jgi:hypothetical protein
MTADIMALRRGQALKAGQFDSGCGGLTVVAELPEGRATRYRLSGCGATMVYLCENVEDGRRDTLDVMVVGAQAIEARCRQVSAAPVTPPPPPPPSSSRSGIDSTQTVEP